MDTNTRTKEYEAWLSSNHDGRKFLTKMEVAAALSVSSETIKRRVSAGKLKAMRLGSNTLSFDIKDVANFMAESVK